MIDVARHSSAYWHRRSHFKVVDPDGWERRDLYKDWCKPITKAEFDKKLAHSTVVSREHGNTSWSMDHPQYGCGDEYAD